GILEESRVRRSVAARPAPFPARRARTDSQGSWHILLAPETGARHFPYMTLASDGRGQLLPSHRSRHGAPIRPRCTSRRGLLEASLLTTPPRDQERSSTSVRLDGRAGCRTARIGTLKRGWR